MQYYRLIFLVISFLFWFVSQIVLQQTQTELTNKTTKNRVLSDIYNLMQRYKAYLDLQRYTNKYSLKDVLKTIKSTAKVDRCIIKLNRKTDKTICFDIVIQSKNEQDLYKFLYLVENYIPGIVSILDLKIERRSNPKWICNMNINIANSMNRMLYKSENKFKYEHKLELSSYIENVCNFTIFSDKKMLKHKLYGIMLPFVFIDNLRLQKKDSVGDYSIEEVYRDRIILKNRKNVLKDIALGEAF